MALKHRIAKLEDVPETVRSLYKAQGSEFVLDVEGVVSEDELGTANAKIAEFRDTNITLKREVDGYKTKFKDVDPEKYKTLTTEVETLRRTTVPEAQTIQQAVDKALEPFQTKLKQQEDATRAAEARYQQKVLEDALWEVGVRSGVRETQRKAWLAEAMPQFRRVDGQLLGFKLLEDGKEQPLFSKRRGKAAEPLTAEEWATEIAPLDATLSEYYKESKGGGARNEQRQTSTADGRRLLPNDPATLSQNIEALATGKAVVAAP